MSKYCQFEGCKRRSMTKKDKFCLKHAKQTLREHDDSGYFQALEITTIDGTTRLAKRRFLTELEILMGVSAKNFSG